MILVDFSGILYQNIYGSIAALNPSPDENGKYLLRDFMPFAKCLMLESLFTIQQNYQAVYGGITICTDSSTSCDWRKQYLPSYKQSRSEERRQSEIPFSQVFNDANYLIHQLRENTPWKVVNVDYAEADDVILCLAKQYAPKEKVLIISADKDMIQAQRHGKPGNVKQFSPTTKKWISPETKGGSMEFWLQEHVILGDAVDEVPKITDRTEFSIPFKNHLLLKGLQYTPREYNKLSLEDQEKIESTFEVYDRWGHKDIWKNPRIGPAKIQKILDEGKLDEFLDSNELYRENYERNKHLVLDDYIPSEIYAKCVENYINAKTETHTDEFIKYLRDCGLEKLTFELPMNFVRGAFSLEDF